MYVSKEGTIDKSPVLCWGILDDGTVVPLTLSGTWDGVSNNNSCVVLPDGSCGKYEQSWPTIAAAIADLRKIDE
jgi:hypothetical protein